MITQSGGRVRDARLYFRIASRSATALDEDRMSSTLRAASYLAVAVSLFATIAVSEPSFALETAPVPVLADEEVPTLETATDTFLDDDNATAGTATTRSAVQIVPAARPAQLSRTLASLVSEHAQSATDDSQAECLAGAVYFEAKGESLEGQLAVADVVVNRAHSGGRFPSSVCSVVFQPGQFSFVRGNGFPPIARDGLAWKRAVAIAHIALGDMWDSKAETALFFHAARVSPNWRKTRVATIGNHVFYR